MRDKEHPSCRELKVVSSGRGSGTSRARVQRHLRDGCRRCQRIVQELVETSYPADLSESGLDWMAAWESRAQANSDAVEELLGELGEHPTGRQLMLVRGARRFQTLGMVKALCRRSKELIGQDSVKACGLARVAVALAESLEIADYPSGLVNDFEARAWVCVGHAERRRSNLVASELAFRFANEKLRQGTGDELEWARFFYRQGWLRSDQGRAGEALALMKLAKEIHERLENYEEVARILLDEGVVLADVQGEHLLALCKYLVAREYLDSKSEPRLLLAIAHNAATALLELGLLKQALAYIRGGRRLYERVAKKADLLRRTWLEARILAKLGWSREAGEKFARARKGFVDLGAPREATILALEEALVVDVRHRRAILQHVVESLLPALEAQGVEREAVAALHAVRQEIATEVQLQTVRAAITVLTQAGRATRG